MKSNIIIILLVAGITTVSAQSRIFTKSGTISFSAGTAVEDVDGSNKSVTSIVDTGTGQIEFAVLMRGFEFKRALMQDHFNENYVESEKFPKSIFKGKVLNISDVDFTKDGTYAVKVKGSLDLHGVSKEIEVPATFTVSKGVISAISEFIINNADFNITIPGAVADKVSPTVSVQVSCTYKTL
jgi:polyisoprenoid-binding protein YceI